MQFYSQFGQDKYVDDYFKQKNNGVFLDVGAYDGIAISNTYFLEKFRNWTGLCIEPLKDKFDLLCKNRKCHKENIAVSDKNGIAEFMEVRDKNETWSSGFSMYSQSKRKRGYNVKTVPLQSLIDKHNLYNIDYFSLDVENAELLALKGLDLNKTKIKLMTVENNGYKDNRKLVNKYLSSFGYKLIGTCGIDEVFEREEKEGEKEG